MPQLLLRTPGEEPDRRPRRPGRTPSHPPAETARLRFSECLDVCERSNVIVIGPSAEGRAAGARPVWLGLVRDQEAIAEITDWITAGGPGIAAPPAASDLYEFSRPAPIIPSWACRP
ncbi:MAG TPA: hypothetical protein VGX23_30245 [Actinocrinis sp.]|nr:hypothetical protein [Actinocrinis sp.]